jgi:flagellar motility protein MotE (MotC chaperone)
VELLGVKVSGASAPALFLVVGAAMMLSCFGWATAEREVAEKTQEVTQKTAEIQEKSRELARVTEQSTHMARDLARVKVAYEEQRALSADLVARMPSALERLPAEQRARLEAPAVELSPSTLDALRRLRP